MVFKNLASRPYNIHCPGVVSSKEDRGYAFGNDSLEGGNAVPPGATHIYNWHIPTDAGPSVADDWCVASAYYSTVDREKDLNSGLIGPVVICKKE